MSATHQAEFPAHAGSLQTSSDRRKSGDEKSEEADSELEKSNDAENGFAPIKPATTSDNRDLHRLQSSRSRGSRPVERSWSLNDGYSCNNDTEAGAVSGGRDGAEAAESEFVVRWDENDPQNPRNFNTLRRWIIVIICSTGSLCV